MRQHLLIDADDTLWENNIYFERAWDEFLELLQHPHMTPQELRDVFDGIELGNIRTHGYGAKNFGRNMVQCFEHFRERSANAAEQEQIRQLAHRILDHPIELMPGVEHTLQQLNDRHELTMFTKGDPEEQRAKVERSGVQHLFHHVEIVREKHREAYLDVTTRRDMERERAWMIGNSPKSDINPALAAGLHAVYIPHERTWVLERTELLPQEGRRLLQLSSFADLLGHF
jgi:putative hydrolase of the HAD superfamily